ncbi:MAG: DUF4258 domain-containing protein [Chlamydiae bacterium]|nr:MAG: DUF4258 domain-containing protein [Chlamydiota bacterium]
MTFDFSNNKKRKIFEERGITFQDAIDAISEKGILKYFDHPNKEKYPNQKVLVVEINNYTYCVPHIIDNGKLFLKTVIPNRKFMYLLEENK